MRRFKHRLLSFGLLVALSALVTSVAGHSALGQPVLPGQPGKKGDKDKDKEKELRSELDKNLPFAPPYDRDHKRRLEGVRDYLNVNNPANIKWGEVVGFLQFILDSKSDSFFDVRYKSGDQTLTNRISVKTEANRIISTFPAEGLQFYQQQHGAAAAQQLDDAIKANYDLATLADLSQKYFHTRAGAEGTVLLATLYLERGSYIEAAYAFERLLARKDVDDLFTARTLFKACIALKRAGDPKHAELYKKALADLEKAAKNGVQIGRTTYTMDKVRAELERPVELMRASALVGEWAMRGGNPSRSAVVDGGPPFLDPLFRTTMFYKGDDEGNLWIKGELDKLFNRDSRAANAARATLLPGAFPVTTSDVLMYRAYDGVYGVATRDRVDGGGRVIRAGEVLWRSVAEAGLHQLVSSADENNDIDMKRDVQQWWNVYNSRTANASSIFYENPLIGALAHDGQNVYYIDDVAVTPPPVVNPQFGGIPQQQYRQGGELAEMVRAGRLVAVDVNTGRRKWYLGREPADAARPPLLNEEESDKTTDAFRLCLDAVFLGPPLPMNGKLYVLVEQSGCVRLLCLDPRNLVAVPGQTKKPALVWSQKLGKPNNTLPQDSIRRYQGAILASSEGILVCPTNAGVVVAVDTMSRSLLWAYGYREVEAPKNPGFDPNTGQPIMPKQLENERWRAAGPIVSNGRVILTAYDSRELECLDLRTGKRLWRAPRETDDLYVGGVVNDRVVVVGRNSVRAYRLTGEENGAPKAAWEPVVIPTPTGHGAVSRNAFYVPVRQENAGRDNVPAGEIWAVNVETGAVLSKTAARKRNDTSEIAKFGLGNLVFQDGMVFAQSPWEVACFPQLEVKIKEMNKLLAANPNDPIGLLARGELRLDDGKLKEAVEDFKAAEKNDLPAEKRPQLREKLYTAYTELLRADFASAESFLKEYEPLCEVPAGANETAEDKVRRDDETKRRKRLYFYLLARGREAQGRLSDAFDQYLALANLGEGKQLLDMPDEPSVKMRPDVWARGRIEAMIRRATTADARKSLEDRVNKEWDAVKGGTDLPKLREFVAVFGPFFEAGRAAQFKLADVLLSTNNDADVREAQAHLSQLRASAEDPQVRARATEALAQLMIKSRMMEDAVALYMQLGKEFAAVPVRDGKTGADFLTNLLTDKRLLPFLEPSRFPLPSRVTAAQGQLAQPFTGQVFELEAPADLFPMYRRARFTLDQFVSGGNGWTLRGFDRGTQRELFRFSGIPNLYFYSPNGQQVPFTRFVQGNGHIAILQFGFTVYCYDLAEKKELWRKDLFPETPLVQNNSYMVEVYPDGDLSISPRNNNGTLPSASLCRAALLQPGYVCMITADGLECVEPLTRRVLWTRRGVSERTQLIGDGRYIVLIELDAQRKPLSTKLIRAVDGMAVENAPDSAKVLSETRSYKLTGRYALLASGTGDQPRALRYYDLATGKDVWKKEFDAKAIPISAPLDPDLCGFVKGDGTAELYSVRTGDLVAKLQIDEKNREAQIKASIGAQVLSDADRFYLILDRDPSLGSTNGTRTANQQQQVRSLKVNGPLYAFDRATGKRLWAFADILENQNLVIEQFAEVPVLMATSLLMRDGTNRYNTSVVVIEKERGKLVFDRDLQQGGTFFNVTVDHKNGSVSLNRNDLRIHITEDPKKP
jgi:outer membrane protein assembly factor BamB/tetratricopeptide (TPR) repeat protein